jgi:hypothetical protein
VAYCIRANGADGRRDARRTRHDGRDPEPDGRAPRRARGGGGRGGTGPAAPRERSPQKHAKLRLSTLTGRAPPPPHPTASAAINGPTSAPARRESSVRHTDSGRAADWGGLGVRNGAWRAAAHRDRRRRGSIEPGRSPQTLMPLLEPWLRHNHGPGGLPDCSSCGPRPAGSPWARWVAAAGRWRGLRRWCASLRVDEWVEGVLSTRRLASALSLIATST